MTPRCASSHASASCAGVTPSGAARVANFRLRQQRALMQRRVRHDRRCHAARASRAQTQLRFRARRGCREPGWPRSARLREAPTVPPCRRRRNSTRPSARSCRRAQALERVDGFRERDAPAPVQQIEVDAIGAQARKAALARGDRALRRSRCADTPCSLRTRGRGRPAIASRDDRARRRRRRTSRRCRSSVMPRSMPARSAATSRAARPRRSPMCPCAEAERGHACAVGESDRGKPGEYSAHDGH